jgi:hypothetical protein
MSSAALISLYAHRWTGRRVTDWQVAFRSYSAEIQNGLKIL